MNEKDENFEIKSLGKKNYEQNEELISNSNSQTQEEIKKIN